MVFCYSYFAISNFQRLGNGACNMDIIASPQFNKSRALGYDSTKLTFRSDRFLFYEPNMTTMVAFSVQYQATLCRSPTVDAI